MFDYCKGLLIVEEDDDLFHVTAEYPDTAITMVAVTAADDFEIAEAAMKIGIYGYMIKPFNANVEVTPS